MGASRAMASGRRVRSVLAALAVTALVAVSAPHGAQAAPAPTGWLHTEGSRIVTSTGETYTVRGASWFGMETPNCAPHGLWTIGLDEGMSRLAGMGFTTVRLPYSNECLAASSTSSINASVNPGLVGLTPLQLMDAVISRAKAFGLNVILDRHRPGSDAQSELWYTSRYGEQRWIDDWTMLAARYRDDPTVIGVDLHNEPHGAACWGCGDPSRDWRAAATRAGDAVLAINPNLLILVEGVQTQSDGTTTWWGGGLKDAAAAPVTLSVPGRLVYSPHEYPASVFAQRWFGAPDYPANLPGIWDVNWGSLHKNGVAPVLLGEFGTRLQTDSDRLWLRTLVEYLRTTGMSYIFWSFNPNSGDTGGLVGDDWRTPQTEKLDALRPILPPRATPTPSASPSPSASPRPSGSPSPSASSTPRPTATPTPRPTPTRSPTPTPTPRPTGASGAVSAAWSLQSSWAQGYVADVSVTATGTVRGWSVSWESPGATSIVNAWGMTCTLSGKTITCAGADWAAAPAPGQTVRVGLQVAASAAPSSPTLAVSSR